MIINENRSYYTSRTIGKEGKESLYAKISPLGSPGISIKPELDGWVEKGYKIRVAELLRIIHDLRKRKRFTQALEVISCIFCNRLIENLQVLDYWDILLIML